MSGLVGSGPAARAAEALVGSAREAVDAAHLLGHSLACALRPPFVSRRLLTPQLERVVRRSLGPVVAVSALAGLVLGGEGAIALERLGVHDQAPGLLALLVVRQLGPLLTGVVVAARSGASFSGELAAMRVGHQIDSLVVLATDPVRYLVLPRLLAAAIAVPVLALAADAAALLGIALATGWSGAAPFDAVTGVDVATGMAKAAGYGVVCAVVCCHAGWRVRGRGPEVGQAASRGVARSLLVMLVVEALLATWVLQ